MQYLLQIIGVADDESSDDGDGPTAEEFISWQPALVGAGVLVSEGFLGDYQLATSVQMNRGGEHHHQWAVPGEPGIPRRLEHHRCPGPRRTLGVGHQLPRGEVRAGRGFSPPTHDFAPATHCRAARAELLRKLDRHNEAIAAHHQALDLTGNDSERNYLSRRMRQLTKTPTLRGNRTGDAP